MYTKKLLALTMAAFLALGTTGCSSNNESKPSSDTDKPIVQKTGYEGYMEIVNKLSNVKSYHLSIKSEDTLPMDAYQIEEIDVTVQKNKDSDIAYGTFKTIEIDDNNQEIDITCKLIDDTEDCDGTVTYKDGKRYDGKYTIEFAKHFSEILVLPSDDFKQQKFEFGDNKWTVTAVSTEGNDYKSTLTLDSNGYPSIYTIDYEGIFTVKYSNIIE